MKKINFEETILLIDALDCLNPDNQEARELKGNLLKSLHQHLRMIDSYDNHCRCGNPNKHMQTFNCGKD